LSGALAGRAAPLRARPLAPAERGAALEHLAQRPQDNLFLLDLTARLGEPPSPGELATEIVCAWRGREVAGVVGLRPSVVFDAGVGPELLAAFRPFLEGLGVGLVKSPAPAVDLFWAELGQRRRRRALIDRLETAYVLRPGGGRLDAGGPLAARGAEARDLEALVVAARESLREEGRPDPFAGDARGFRRWVEGRLGRARVIASEGRIVFVGYADVQRAEGWLIQGVYTWPEARRRGFARAGMRELCREAFQAGAEHVQLAVVDGNEAARGLYEGLGFEPFAVLRTILFA
jgi:ribosomal protein S18 acetylase RimI-like enzyme